MIKTWQERMPVLNNSLLGSMEAEIIDLRAENQRLTSAITKLHSAKGRYHTQLACCDLFDLVGLKNVRPVK